MSDDALDTSLRTVTQARLLALGIPPFAIGRWCEAWEVEGRKRGLEMGAPFWEDGIRWIVAQVAAGKQPPG